MLNKINTRRQTQKLIVYIVLILATIAVLRQVNHYDFINLDDYKYVMFNNHILSGITLDGIRWAFGTRYFDLWHPLLWLSLMFDYQLYSLNPGGYHLTNLILHILSTLLLFWLFHRMTGAVWKSAFVAAFFALHPLHVESVAWISERKDVLSAFFWMLTLCLYVYYTEKPVIKRYLLVVFSFVCALMSKPMVVTLPVIMMLLDYWPLNRFETKKDNPVLWQVKEKLPFFVLSTILVIITLYNPGSIETSDFFPPLGLRLVNAPISFVTYLEKTFWPHNLAIFYPFSDQLLLWQVLGTIILIIVISVFVAAIMKRLPYLFVGWFWYVITILPVIGIIQIWLCGMADRYYYLPSIGISILLAWGVPSLIKSEKMRKNILFPAGLIFIAVMSLLTWKQGGYWENNATIFSHAIQANKNNYLAHRNFASALSDEGKFKEAFYHYNEAIRIKPDYSDIYYNRGNAYTKLCKYQQALEDYNKAITLNPASAETFNNRGFIYIKFGQYQRAIEDYSKAISLKQDYADAYSNRAFVYLHLGNKELGCSDARKTCELGSCAALQAALAKGLCR